MRKCTKKEKLPGVTGIMQGDRCTLPVRISCGGEPLTDDHLSAVEVVIGGLRKASPEVAYNRERGVWEFPLLQSESMGLKAAPAPVQVRAVFHSGDIVGTNAGSLRVAASASREEL